MMGALSWFLLVTSVSPPGEQRLTLISSLLVGAAVLLMPYPSNLLSLPLHRWSGVQPPIGLRA